MELGLHAALFKEPRNELAKLAGDHRDHSDLVNASKSSVANAIIKVGCNSVELLFDRRPL